LPGFARQAGKALVGLRNWIQRSPDAQLFLRARDELEAELRTIRDDLAQEMESVRLEMQTVRDEMMQVTREATLDAARQLDEATHTVREAQEVAAQVQHSVEQLEQALPVTPEELLDAAPGSVEPVAPPAALPDLVADEALQTIAPPRLETPDPENGQPPQPVARVSKPYAPPQPADPLRTEIGALKEQIDSLALQVRDLQQQLRSLQAAAPVPQATPDETHEPQEVAG
jgi:hypothetical protein